MYDLAVCSDGMTGLMLKQHLRLFRQNRSASEYIIWHDAHSHANKCSGCSSTCTWKRKKCRLITLMQRSEDRFRFLLPKPFSRRAKNDLVGFFENLWKEYCRKRKTECFPSSNGYFGLFLNCKIRKITSFSTWKLEEIRKKSCSRVGTLAGKRLTTKHDWAGMDPQV